MSSLTIEERKARAKKALAEVRKLREAKKVKGVSAIYDFVSDIEGEWLDKW